jgi:hypothetical protein
MKILLLFLLLAVSPFLQAQEVESMPDTLYVEDAETYLLKQEIFTTYFIHLGELGTYHSAVPRHDTVYSTPGELKKNTLVTAVAKDITIQSFDIYRHNNKPESRWLTNKGNILTAANRKILVADMKKGYGFNLLIDEATKNGEAVFFFQLIVDVKK